MDIDLDPDTVHSPERTLEIATATGRCLNTLVYATREGRGGLIYPGDVYDLTAELCIISARIGDLVGNLQKWFTAELAAGRLKVDSLTVDPERTPAQVLNGFSMATTAVLSLHSACELSYAALSHIAANE